MRHQDLAATAGISRATLYRSYRHLKDNFERRLVMLQTGGHEPDPRDAQIQRLKAGNNELRQRLATLDVEGEELRSFKTTAISRLAAQHAEIVRLRNDLKRGGTPQRYASAEPTREVSANDNLG